MTWLWRISSSLVAAGALHAAAVSGVVRLENSQEASVRKQRDYSGVVVSLTPVGETPRPRTGPRPAARIVQKNKTFLPHVLAVEVGTTVDFPNDDSIFHNAFSNYDGRVFDVGLYPPHSTRKVLFDRPGIVRVFCNIHASMSAVIAVLQTPLFSTSAANGAFSIAPVPPGEYLLQVFHERATKATLKALERRLRVGDSNIDLGAIAVSEAGYLVIPHNDKYGKPYDGAGGENPLYPATRK